MASLCLGSNQKELLRSWPRCGRLHKVCLQLNFQFECSSLTWTAVYEQTCFLDKRRSQALVWFPSSTLPTWGKPHDKKLCVQLEFCRNYYLPWYPSKYVLVLDILLAKAADDSRAAVELHIQYSFRVVNPSQRQKDWTRNSYKLI